MSSDLKLVAARSNTPVFINQSMLNDLVRDLALPKYKAEILGSRLKQWNLLEQETKISEFHHCNEKLSSFFDSYNSLCFCNDVDGLIENINTSVMNGDYLLTRVKHKSKGSAFA